jgi:tRNA (guanosine-2'-O-)-methyltransferase
MDGLLRGGRLTSFDPSWFEHAGRTLTSDEILAILRPHLSDSRLRRINDVLEDRTYNLTVVVDGMVDTGNVSAVMRSADAFGVQAFCAIDRAGSYKHSRRTAQGVRKWVDRWVWRDADAAVGWLRDRDYRIVVADLDAAAAPPEAIDFSARSAVVVGNELAGVSRTIRDAADEIVQIPMSGFAQSLNISVAAGILLHQARRDRINRLGSHGDLSAADKSRLRAVFAVKSVRHARKILERALIGGQGSSGATSLIGLADPSDSVT